MTEPAEPAASVEGWRPDPFGRHETRFYDGIAGRRTSATVSRTASTSRSRAWTREGNDGPEILTADLLVVERNVDLTERSAPCSVFGRDGRDLGSVRRADRATSGQLEVRRPATARSP